MERCQWAKTELSIPYHDREWGVPVRDERKLFEFLILEGAQAGLSWETILRKREAYRRAFAEFDPQKVARFDARKKESLLREPKRKDEITIVRNRAKVEAAVLNARAFLDVAAEMDGRGGVSGFLWQFVGGEPRVNHRRSLKEVPAETEESRVMSRELKRRGFKFVGPTICYAFMQAVGMVNDHTVSCPRHSEVQQLDRREVCGRRTKGDFEARRL